MRWRQWGNRRSREAEIEVLWGGGRGCDALWEWWLKAENGQKVKDPYGVRSTEMDVDCGGGGKAWGK